MQKEMMLRLIKEDKIIGYMFITPMGLLFAEDINDWLEGLTLDVGGFYPTNPSEYVIKHDAFEQGIKVGDEWVFGQFVKRTDGTYRFAKSKIKE